MKFAAVLALIGLAGSAPPRDALLSQWVQLAEKQEYLRSAPRRSLQTLDVASMASQLADLLANTTKMNIDLLYLFLAAPVEQLRLVIKTTKNIIQEFEPVLPPALYQLLTMQDYQDIIAQIQKSMQETDEMIDSLIELTRGLFTVTSTRPLVVQRVERVSIAEDGSEQHVTKTIVGREGDPLLDTLDSTADDDTAE